MSGSTRTVQVTMGIGQLGAALAAIALAIVLAGVLVVGQFTTTKLGDVPSVGGAPVVIDQNSGSGGSNGTRFPQ